MVFPLCIGDCLISKVIYLSLVSKKKKRAVKKMSVNLKGGKLFERGLEKGSVLGERCSSHQELTDFREDSFFDASEIKSAIKPSFCSFKGKGVSDFGSKIKRDLQRTCLSTPYLTVLIFFFSDPNCKLEDKTEDGEAIDCKKRPEDGEDLEDEVVHSCDSCLQVFESLSDITEHKINQCQLTGKQYPSLLVSSHCSISDFFFFQFAPFSSVVFQLFYSYT